MFQKARESTKKYHTDLYKKSVLFEKGTWLEKPVPDILAVGKKLTEKHNFLALDLGSGIGRNAIPLAKILQQNGVKIICVDYLPIAIEKLNEYAKKHHVKENISGYVSPAEDFLIKKNKYDFIFSHGALAHVKDKKTLLKTLENIANGTKKNGYVYLSIESDLEEIEMNTKKKIKPLVEVSLTSDELKKIYQDLFKDWTIKVLRKDPYIEHYEENFKGIEWKCNFMVIVAKKN
ncbi:MAG: hypothetical protein UR89_C0008G0021 [Candidatus Roizmanbacteria bacterium GW2011_GWA2_35_8]|uniref:Methyltransferase domain-containing protein n=1 Tax=Candidatus Roizmanbacteria bacterium GW2011_GWA2_35_8 TaxID=1618479 RepID=A0A0G0CYH5_9BACT|nr:MAG: hypothetical protein UR89_C0008G0021 [Candidatus Roizmanbacteria bacterium GW2011_GWA2_35_8]